jgi:DNA-binding MarR family transcriptional regulator
VEIACPGGYRIYIAPLYSWAVRSSEWRGAAEALDEVAVFVIRRLTALREISLSAAATLATLDSAGPCRLTDLAAREGVSQPSMTTLVSRLERQGLAERRDDPSDGRIVLVAITEAGRDVLRFRRAGRVAFLASLIGELPQEDRRALAAAVPALRRMTDSAAVPAGLVAARRAAADARVADEPATPKRPRTRSAAHRG